MKKIEKLLPLDEENIYLPEYEVRLNFNGRQILAKFDLVVINQYNIILFLLLLPLKTYIP